MKNLNTLFVISQTGPRFQFVYEIAKSSIQNNKLGIVLFGNGIYNILNRSFIEKNNLIEIPIFVHKPSIIERGIDETKIPNNAILIDDLELLELIIRSKKTLCI